MPLDRQTWLSRPFTKKQNIHNSSGSGHSDNDYGQGHLSRVSRSKSRYQVSLRYSGTEAVDHLIVETAGRLRLRVPASRRQMYPRHGHWEFEALFACRLSSTPRVSEKCPGRGTIEHHAPLERLFKQRSPDHCSCHYQVLSHVHALPALQTSCAR